MYISNGFVYGSQPFSSVRVQAVKPLDDMIMILHFQNGESRLFDATVLQGPAFAPLQDPAVFKTAAVDHGVVTWLDGEIDCAPEFLYEHSYEYSMVI
jgi:hypothetical protein